MEAALFAGQVESGAVVKVSVADLVGSELLRTGHVFYPAELPGLLQQLAPGDG